MEKREFLKAGALLTAGALVAPSVLFGSSTAEAAPTGILADKGPHTLPKLPYAYEALEPHIDKQTMELHHKGHHQAYVDNLNAAVLKTPMEKITLDAFFKNISKYQPVIRNNAGGHYNHTFFWETLNPAASIPMGGIDTAIKKKFQSLDAFKAAFNKEAMNVFGSGWVWLCVNKANKDVFIVSTPNQDNPLMEIPGTVKGVPVIAIDVWEHAYYLKHQNKRKDYIAAFWNLVDWNKAEQRFQEATASKAK
jgi:Fe-Mn family superoxide dismutase